MVLAMHKWKTFFPFLSSIAGNYSYFYFAQFKYNNNNNPVLERIFKLYTHLGLTRPN